MKSWAKRYTGRPSMRADPVTTPSPGTRCASMPKSVAWWTTNRSSSSKEPLSTSPAIRSRAVRLPPACCRAIRSAPPPSSAAPRRRASWANRSSRLKVEDPGGRDRGGVRRTSVRSIGAAGAPRQRAEARRKLAGPIRSSERVACVRHPRKGLSWQWFHTYQDPKASVRPPSQRPPRRALEQWSQGLRGGRYFVIACPSCLGVADDRSLPGGMARPRDGSQPFAVGGSWWSPS